jgi:hypothetical protein
MKGFKIFSWCFLAISALLLLIINVLPYGNAIRFISRISGYPKIERISSLLTPEKFQMVRLTPVIGILIGILFLVFSKSIYRTIIIFTLWFKHIFTFISRAIRSMPANEKLLLAGIIFLNLIVKLFLATNFLITYDEAWTYINFTSRSFISSMTYYAAPNNHILNSVLTNITYLLPLPDTLALRLPAVLSNALFLFVLYILSRRVMSRRVSIFLLLIISFIMPVLFYGFTARGYSLILLFFTVCYFITVQLLQNTKINEHRNLFYFSLSSALGFYAMPSFLYPYLTLNIFLVVYALFSKRNSLAKKTVIWSILTGCVVLVLYTPVFLISGVHSVTSNSYVHPISRAVVVQGLFKHFTDTFEYLFSFKYAIFYALAITFLPLAFSKHKSVVVLNIWILLFSFCIPVIHSVLPFTRVWIYLLVPISVSTGLFIDLLFYPRIKPTVVIFAGAVITVVSCLASYNSILRQEHYAIEAKKADDFLINSNIFSIYIDEPLMDTYVIYTYKINKLNLDCFIHREEFEARRNDIEVVLLATGKKPSDITSKPLFSNKHYSIYRNPYYKN